MYQGPEWDERFPRHFRRWAREFGKEFGRDWNRGREWGRGPWERGEQFRERLFGKGDLKYMILDLLRDQPRHGYDIIRELENRCGGMYTPSAGAVYPTLQMLEDMGAVTAAEQDGRKVYTITDEGRRILEERRDVVDEIAERVRQWIGGARNSEMQQAMREMGETMALLAREGGRAWNDPNKLRRIREVIARTREDLRAILRDEVQV